MTDLLIIGAGLTGLFAACTAARAGLNVRVIAQGAGTTHWHAGTIDLLGYLPDGQQPVANWMKALGRLPPAHPYRLLGAASIASALDAFQQLAAAAGLPYERAAASIDPPGPSAPSQPIDREDAPAGQFTDIAPGRNGQLISPVGAARPVFLAPQAQLAASLEDERPLLIIGFNGMTDFYPALIAENLRRQGRPARSAVLPLSRLTNRRDHNTIQLARLLDQPAAQEMLIEMVSDAAATGERIGLPAVLGLKTHTRLLARLHQAGSAPDRRKTPPGSPLQPPFSLFEIPTLPPSVPGMRLDASLRAQLTRLRVRVEIGMKVCCVRTAGRRIEWIETESGSRPLRHTARNYLLATGGILGGGIRGDRCGRVRETVFDLPLTAPQTRSQWLRPIFLDKRGHPVFQGGVPVDTRFRPLGRDGAPVYDNLWAAGSVLAHTDPIRERSREGIAIATGFAAAHSVANGQ